MFIIMTSILCHLNIETDFKHISWAGDVNILFDIKYW